MFHLNLKMQLWLKAAHRSTSSLLRVSSRCMMGNNLTKVQLSSNKQLWVLVTSLVWDLKLSNFSCERSWSVHVKKVLNCFWFVAKHLSVVCQGCKWMNPQRWTCRMQTHLQVCQVAAAAFTSEADFFLLPKPHPHLCSPSFPPLRLLFCVNKVQSLWTP